MLRRALRRNSGAGLLLAALVATGLATYRLRAALAATGDPIPAAIEVSHEDGLPDAPHLLTMRQAVPLRAHRTRVPGAAPPDAGLAALRARISRGDPRAPAAEVDRWVLRFVTEPRRREELEAGLGRMARYEPLVREALRRYGQPEELLYLPIVESQFLETAVSHAGAAGMWQFMPGTARLYGLEVSEYVDERLDPVRSTEAAVRHLADLHRQFGSWHLALAGYNAGAGRIEAALRRHAGGRRGDEVLFWRIRAHLPRETRRYVPLYLAATEVARHPEGFGVRPRRQPPLAFAEVWVPGGIALEEVARQHGVSPATLGQLNPHLIRGTTPPGRRWPVRVPPPIPHTGSHTE